MSFLPRLSRLCFSFILVDVCDWISFLPREQREFLEACTERGAGNAHKDYDPSWFSYTIDTGSYGFCNNVPLPTSRPVRCLLRWWYSKASPANRQLWKRWHVNPTYRGSLWAALKSTSLVSCNIQWMPCDTPATRLWYFPARGQMYAGMVSGPSGHWQGQNGYRGKMDGWMDG